MDRYTKERGREMYRIRIDTGAYQSKERKGYDRQLADATCVKLNGLVWEYKTWGRLEDRLNMLTGQGKTSIAPYADGNRMVVTVRGEKVETSKRLPGMCSGYVCRERMREQVERAGEVRINFSSFYDARQNPDSLGLDRCYIIVEKK